MQIIGTIFLVLLFCTSKPKMINIGIVQMKTVFYHPNGTPSATYFNQVWYKDSLTIEKITRKYFNTIRSKTTVTDSTLFLRFVNLRDKVVYDYRNLSDTARPFNKATLPDSVMDFGKRNYYSHKVRRIQGTPEELSDTSIDHLIYKRIQFNFIGDDLTKGYKIGYYRCNEKARMFSLEKDYSKKINCTMTRFKDFQTGFAGPFATSRN